MMNCSGTRPDCTHRVGAATTNFMAGRVTTDFGVMALWMGRRLGARIDFISAAASETTGSSTFGEDTIDFADLIQADLKIAVVGVNTVISSITGDSVTILGYTGSLAGDIVFS